MPAAACYACDRSPSATANPTRTDRKPLDYGLIAEEVAEVYPDLVVKGADGQIETVQYQKLTPMLLNELQKERRERSEAIEALQAQVAALQKALESFGAIKG